MHKYYNCKCLYVLNYAKRCTTFEMPLFKLNVELSNKEIATRETSASVFSGSSINHFVAGV